MPAFMPIHDLSQLNDMASIPLPIIIKVKDDFDYYAIDSNLDDLIEEHPQIRLATFNIYEKTDIAMKLNAIHVSAPAFLLYQAGEIKDNISGNIPEQVQAFIEKAKESVQ
ncbi:hypothetical protein E3Q22_03809 [Wallemia mellicola]|uniref:Thioredoxin domain-containing protein n=1 Tax=Wallemia mellicola TaxID=1708541 RepID=A0A4T0PDB9_9BASI|nr:hypothetical protein E3Q23_03771 [Wallemia mellicola]TIB72364.1 hypothetical protein E3Q24_01752 [Wallemia mellicola]TIB75930.1 hypothetical protein E3Q22_03809 [Wallemia mellicola]TIB87073.1 hypothetical protein E3Q19_03721 [Wallemia mellicola]TIB95232.1 hypothetical protein E3Q18_03871 [Wallemia mellicola]